MLFTGYLAVSGSGVEAGMPEVFLKQPESVARVVDLYGMRGEGVSESVWADMM